LETNNHPYALFISGNSGTGKNCLVQNYIKALQCENRPPNSSVACGYCAQCKLNPKTKGKYHDVVWVQSGKGGDATINQQFKEALIEAEEPPRLASPKDEHRYYKVIVFDELQSLQINIIENLLFKSETDSVFGKNRVIFILMTMSEQRINQKDPELCKALIDRSDYIKTRTPTSDQLRYFIINRLRVQDPSIINLLVDASDGSYRRLIRYYDQIKNLLLKGADEDTCADEIYVTSSRRRKILWSLLNSNNNDSEELYSYYKYLDRPIEGKLTLKEFWYDTVESCADVTKLLNQLLDDLDRSRELGKDIPLEFDKLICDYLVSERNVSAWHIIKQLKGKNLVDLRIFDHNEHQQDGIELRTK
jgi:DNA polymerase III gamma/tau subunit